MTNFIKSAELGEEMLAGDPVSRRAIWSPSGSMMCPLSGVKLSVTAMETVLTLFVV
jgi:hypothetical protein